MAQSESENRQSAETKGLKKLPRGSVKLQFAGNLILAKCNDSNLEGLFKRYEALFESLANMPKKERILSYKILNALMLTSYAKKSDTLEEKRKLFDLKNKLFLSIAGNPDYRKLIDLKYLVSKNFRITQYCENCSSNNAEANQPRHKWKHCKECSVDRDFYNIVCMRFILSNGYFQIFLSNDQVGKLPFGKPKKKEKLSETKEEAHFGKYQYNSKNLDAIVLDSVMAVYNKFFDL